jgi:hypothetical protein
MPERPGFTLCTCSECLSQRPTGAWIPHSRIFGHRAAVQARIAAQMPVDMSLSQSIESHILLQTMLAEPSDSHHDLRPTYSFPDIANNSSLDREALGARPSTELMSSIQRLAGGDSATHPPAAGSGHRSHPTNLEKRERNKSTQQALRRLAKLESRALDCRKRVLQPSLSRQVFRSLGAEIAGLLRSVEHVTRRSRLVDEKRATVVAQLQELDALHT